MKEKGLNRGGQEAELGTPDRDQQREWQQVKGNLQRKEPGLGKTGPDQGAQRGGLQHEPDLSHREEETGHEVD
jgi:hypothetical protein